MQTRSFGAGKNGEAATMYSFENKNGMVYITIPFAMNRAVSPNEVGGFSLKIKTA